MALGIYLIISSCYIRYKYFFKFERPSSQTVWPTELEERESNHASLLPPGLQSLFFTFTMLSSKIELLW